MKTAFSSCSAPVIWRQPQSVISQIDADLEQAESDSLKTCKKMTDVAKYVARVSKEQQEQADDSIGDSDINISASFIVGGQIRAGEPTIYMIYSAGNYISVSEETPYMQIGESKYGKPILDRVLGPATSLEDAARCALVSMDSTIRSNATVGSPLEVLVYENDTFESDHYIKLTEDDSYLLSLRRAWGEVLLAGFRKLPLFEWEKRSAPPLHAISKERNF